MKSFLFVVHIMRAKAFELYVDFLILKHSNMIQRPGTLWMLKPLRYWDALPITCKQAVQHGVEVCER